MANIITINGDPDLVQVLETVGLTVIGGLNRISVLGRFWSLDPLAIVTEWMLNPPDTEPNRFCRLLRRNADNTALAMISRLRKISHNVDIILYTDYPEEVPDELIRTFDLSVVPKTLGPTGVLTALHNQSVCAGTYDEDGSSAIRRRVEHQLNQTFSLSAAEIIAGQ